MFWAASVGAVTTDGFLGHFSRNIFSVSKILYRNLAVYDKRIPQDLQISRSHPVIATGVFAHSFKVISPFMSQIILLDVLHIGLWVHFDIFLYYFQHWQYNTSKKLPCKYHMPVKVSKSSNRLSSRCHLIVSVAETCYSSNTECSLSFNRCIFDFRYLNSLSSHVFSSSILYTYLNISCTKQSMS